MRRIFVCVLALVVMTASAQAQAPETNPDKCGLLNLAHLYLKCARLNDVMIGLFGNRTSSPEVRKAIKVSEEMRDGFIAISVNLYKIAGRELTTNVLEQRKTEDERDVASGIDEFLRTVQNRVTKEKVAVNPGNILYQCTGPKVTQDIKDEAKARERLGVAMLEADEILKKNKASCIK